MEDKLAEILEVLKRIELLLQWRQALPNAPYPWYPPEPPSYPTQPEIWCDTGESASGDKG